MKKLLALCLCLLLAFSATALSEGAVDAVEETGDDALTEALDDEPLDEVDDGAFTEELDDEPLDEASEETEIIRSIASANGLLYILYDNGVFAAYRPDTRKTSTLGTVVTTFNLMSPEDVQKQYALRENEIGVDRLVSDGGTIYGFCGATGVCWRLLDDDGAFAPKKLPVTLDLGFLMSTEEEYGAMRDVPYEAFIRDDSLYFISDSSASSQNAALAGRISLKTGATTFFKTKNLHHIFPYKDGKLIAVEFDADAIFDSLNDDAKSACTYGIFDPAADLYAPLGELTTTSTQTVTRFSGMCVDPATNTLFFTLGSRVMGLDLGTGKQRVSAYLSYESSSTNCAYISGHYYAIATFMGLDVRALDTEAAKLGALRIFGEYGSDAHRSFIVNYPDIPIETVDEYNSTLDALTNAMVSGSDAYDVLRLSVTTMPVDRLARKGYCTDLSQFPEIAQRVQRMDQRYVKLMTYNNALYGVPVDISVSTFAYSVSSWAELGLTEAELPANLIDFYDFIANYMWDYGDTHSDLLLFDTMDESLRLLLFNELLRQYVVYYQSLGQRLTFDTDLFRELLHAFEQINFKELIVPPTGDYYERPALFSLSASLTDCINRDAEFRPFLTSLTKRVEPTLGASVEVLTVNPRSSRKKDAVTYICNYLDNLDVFAKVLIFPDVKDSIEDPSYPKAKANIERQLRLKKNQLAKADESQKPALRDEIEQQQSMLTMLERYRWRVTAEQIADFRTLFSPYIVATSQSVLLSDSTQSAGSSELTKLYSRYLGGLIDTERFVHDLNQRVRLMILEDM